MLFASHEGYKYKWLTLSSSDPSVSKMLLLGKSSSEDELISSFKLDSPFKLSSSLLDDIVSSFVYQKSHKQKLMRLCSSLKLSILAGIWSHLIYFSWLKTRKLKAIRMLSLRCTELQISSHNLQVYNRLGIGGCLFRGSGTLWRGQSKSPWNRAAAASFLWGSRIDLSLFACEP